MAWSAPSHFLNQCCGLVNCALRTTCSQIPYETQRLSFKKVQMKMSSGKCRLFCFGLNVLKSGNCLHGCVQHRMKIMHGIMRHLRGSGAPDNGSYNSNTGVMGIRQAHSLSVSYVSTTYEKSPMTHWSDYLCSGVSFYSDNFLQNPHNIQP